MKKPETPTQTKLDKVIGYFSPKRGAERMDARFKMAAGAYVGASKSRRETRNWNPLNQDADSNLKYDRDDLISRSRESVRNNPLATGALNTVVSHAVGIGLTHHPKIDGAYLGLTAKETASKENELERWFKLWAESKECDSRRQLNFKEMQSLALRSVLEGGDCFAILPDIKRKGSPFGLKVQLLEAERVSNAQYTQDTTTKVSGVNKDSNGAVKSFDVALQYKNTSIAKTGQSWTTINAFGANTGRIRMFQLVDPVRIEQTRGIPYLTPVLESLRMLSNLTESELMAAVVTAFLTVFVTSESGNGPLQTVPELGGTDPDSEIELGNGTIVDLAEGEKIETVNPNRPNALFDPFFQSICRQIGVALEIPFEILIGHFTASFSASQAAMLSAWRSFTRRRVWLSRNFCEPIRNTFVDELVANGMFSAPGYFSDPLIRKAYLGGDWHGEGKGSLKAFDEAKANQLLNKSGVKSLKTWTTETTGKDWNNEIEQIRQENEIIKDILPSEATNQQTSITVDDEA